MEHKYAEPVSRLFSLDMPSIEEVDYTALGIGPEHIPSLIEVATDMELHNAESEGPDVWAPVHAWRALGQLRAEAACEPLTKLLRFIDESQCDWCAEEIPRVLGEIGPASISPLAAFLQDDSYGLWGRIAASRSIEYVGQQHPDARAGCVAVLTSQLERYDRNEPEFNAGLIVSLTELKAVESAAVIEQVFNADAVDLAVQGDWEEVQIALGLLDERITPRPKFGWFHYQASGGKSAQISSTTSPGPKKKTKNVKKTKRKEQKKMRRKNRRK